MKCRERQAEDLTEEGQTPCSHLVRYSRLAQAPTCRNWHAQYWLDTNWHAASGTRSSPRSNLHRKLPRPLRWCLATLNRYPLDPQRIGASAGRGKCSRNFRLGRRPLPWQSPELGAEFLDGCQWRSRIGTRSVRNNRPNAQTLPLETVREL